MNRILGGGVEKVRMEVREDLKMICEEIQELLPERAMGQLEAEADESVGRHLSDCAQCRAHWEVLQLGLGQLKQWEVEEPPRDLGANTMAAIRREAQQPLGLWARIDRALGRFAGHRPTRLTGLATVAVTLVLLGQVLAPNFSRGRSSSDGSACQRNLKVVTQALESYRKEHAGAFPDQLSQLRPGYLKVLPDCPDSGQDSYSPGYQVSADHHSYTLKCAPDK